MNDIRSVLRDRQRMPRFETGMSRETYKNAVGLNPSSLAAGLIGIGEVDPNAVRLAWEMPDKERATASQDALDCGTLAHLMVLQPELIAEKVAVWTGDVRRGAAWDQFESENDGKLLIRRQDNAKVSVAVNAMRSEKTVTDLIRGIKAEVAMFCDEEIDGLLIGCKGQVDAVNVEKRIIVDLKTTGRGIDQRSVERTIRTLHYREKMAMYRRWMAMATESDPESWECWNLFMSLDEPYGVRAVKFSSMALEWGEDQMLTAINSVAGCLAAKEFPIYCATTFMGVEQYEYEDSDREEIEYGK